MGFHSRMVTKQFLTRGSLGILIKPYVKKLMQFNVSNKLVYLIVNIQEYRFPTSNSDVFYEETIIS